MKKIFLLIFSLLLFTNLYSSIYSTSLKYKSGIYNPYYVSWSDASFTRQDFNLQLNLQKSFLLEAGFSIPIHIFSTDFKSYIRLGYYKPIIKKRKNNIFSTYCDKLMFAMPNYGSKMSYCDAKCLFVLVFYC